MYWSHSNIVYEGIARSSQDDCSYRVFFCSRYVKAWIDPSMTKQLLGVQHEQKTWYYARSNGSQNWNLPGIWKRKWRSTYSILNSNGQKIPKAIISRACMRRSIYLEELLKTSAKGSGIIMPELTWTKQAIILVETRCNTKAKETISTSNTNQELNTSTVLTTERKKVAICTIQNSTKRKRNDPQGFCDAACFVFGNGVVTPSRNKR